MSTTDPIGRGADPAREFSDRVAASGAMPDIDRLRKGSPDEAARQLEGLFLTTLIKEMRQTLSEGFFGSGPGAGIYEGLFDQMLAESMAQGTGTGLRQAILDGWGEAPSGSDQGGTPKSENEVSEIST
jgi:Rod binding domain-containing protein